VKERITVIGGAGNVGRGVVEAFKNENWAVEVVDPQINRKFEDLTDTELGELFRGVEHVIYTAESGNREDYAKDPNLSSKNNKRFSGFCEKIIGVNPEVIIWYIGGSWTKRKPDRFWIVYDDSPNKPTNECNEYEKAKISAEENARRLSESIRIRFLDWASIVPNLADNFSIPRMVVQAVEEGRARYSPGDYGRPLLEVTQAGEALVLLVENDKDLRFQKILIPGVFMSFLKFAKAVREIIREESGKEIKLTKIDKTPGYLRTKTYSEKLNSLGFWPNVERVQKALAVNAEQYLEKLETESEKKSEV
jgi:nucleoside-diphosphate-sugar epimerase